MLALLPRTFGRLALALEQAKVRERLYTSNAQQLVSKRLIVNNVGASDAYQSPSHLDAGDEHKAGLELAPLAHRTLNAAQHTAPLC